MIKVYFDGMCGLCSREISYYKRIAPDGAIEWVDVAREPEALSDRGVGQADALRVLHAIDAEGRMHRGVAAFILIWRALPYWRRLAPLVALPGPRHVAEFVYQRFATWRFNRLEHCQIAAAEEA